MNKLYRGNTMLTVIITVIITLLAVAAGYFIYQNQQLQSQLSEIRIDHGTETPAVSDPTTVPEIQPVPDLPEPEIAVAEPTDPCDFSKDISLKPTTTYGVFGDDEFDTAICGYMVTKQEQVFDETYNSAYFVITKFLDPEFENSLMDGINQGNTINSLIDGNIAMGIGCYEDNKLINMGNTNINTDAAAAIIASGKDNPVALIFSFEVHEGFGAACAGLMEEISMY